MNAYRIALMDDLDGWTVVKADNKRMAVGKYATDLFDENEHCIMTDYTIDIAIIFNGIATFESISTTLVPNFECSQLDDSSLKFSINMLNINMDDGDISPEIGLIRIEHKKEKIETLNQRMAKARKYAKGFDD